MNPFILMKFIETQLIMLNPICPHFAQYCWENHVLPVYEKSNNLPHKPAKLLMDQGWPQVSKQYDGILRRMYDYLKSVKSSIRVAEQKAQTGGKKPKAQAKGAAAETKAMENVALFVALEYPDWQKQTLEIL
jgi:leucyl-tRNA synthetase